MVYTVFPTSTVTCFTVDCVDCLDCDDCVDCGGGLTRSQGVHIFNGIYTVKDDVLEATLVNDSLTNS